MFSSLAAALALGSLSFQSCSWGQWLEQWTLGLRARSLHGQCSTGGVLEGVSSPSPRAGAGHSWADTAG